MGLISIGPSENNFSLYSFSLDPDPPSNLRAALDNDNDTLTVTWALPMGDPPIGYVITYEETAGGGDTGSIPVMGGTAMELAIPDRDGNQYTVTIRVLSIHLPSITVETVSTTRGEYTSCRNVYIIIIINITLYLHSLYNLHGE